MTCKAWPDYLQVQGAGLASTLPSERTEGMRLRPVISIKLSASGLTLKNTNSENSEYELVKKTD